MSTKKTYQFTLVLKHVHQATDNLEDSLYEAGCDDALINFKNNTVYLDFDREANSLEEAVMSAVRDVESSSVGASVASVAPEDLVNEAEIAKRLLRKRQAVSLWIKGERRRNHLFPHPVMKLADKSPLWKWREVVEWLQRNDLINNTEMLDNAYFLEHINAVLEEREESVRHSRKYLLQQLRSYSSYP